MAKILLYVLTVGIILLPARAYALSMPSTTAAAPSTSNLNSARSQTKSLLGFSISSFSSIWSGLWDGSNFDLSRLGSSKSAPISTPDSRPMPPQLPSPAPTTTVSYAALGDSVAAGLGLPLTSNSSSDVTCGRSTQAYPYTVSKALNLPLTHAACSGATVGDLFTKQDVDGSNITAQLDTAYSNGKKPGVITITAGANDAHWSSFIQSCYVTNCASATSTALANAYLIGLQAKLYVALSLIHLRSNGTPPMVVVTGYYNPLSLACLQYQNNITADEINWITAETTALNTTLQNVTSRYSFAKFAAVDFNGHDICSGNSWVQGLSDAAPFHPTATGQQVIAQSVLRSLGH